MLAALILGLLGTAVGDLFTMRVSAVLAAAGLIHLFMGTRYLKALSFPLAYLSLMVPPPYLLVKQISYHLRMLDAFLAAGALQTFGVPVYRDAYFLHLPSISLEVADVCSGIASLFAMLALGMIYVHSLPVGWRSKAAVMMGVVVFPVAANVLRVFLVGFTVYYYGPIMLGAFFHRFSGTFTFGLALVTLISCGEFLRRKWPGKVIETSAARGEETGVPSAGNAGDEPARVQPGQWVFFLAVAVFAGSIYLSGHLSAQRRVSLNFDLRELPATLGSYVLSKANATEPYQDPNAENSLARFYDGPDHKQMELFIGYRGYQDGQNRLFSPKLVLPERWNFVWVESDRIAIPGFAPLTASWMLTQNGETQRLVLYWYQARGRSFASEISHRVDQLVSAFSSGRTDGAVVRIATPVSEDEKLENAKERIRKFVAYVYPHLARLLPG